MKRPIDLAREAGMSLEEFLSTSGDLAKCHPECGPIVARENDEHAHENEDGRCWHNNDDIY